MNLVVKKDLDQKINLKGRVKQNTRLYIKGVR